MLYIRVGSNSLDWLKRSPKGRSMAGMFASIRRVKLAVLGLARLLVAKKSPGQ